MLNWVLSILSFCLLLGGSLPERQPACRVVTQITVQWTQDGADHQRIYTDQGKMNKLLIYLRSLMPRPRHASDAEPQGPVYRITLTLSDGTVHRCFQWGTAVFRKGEGPWLSVDPEDAIRLPLILEVFPGDVTN